MSSLTAISASDLFRGEPHRYLDVGAGEAAYWKVGAGPDVLFVHGWPVSGATWRKLLPYMIDHVTCHVIDLPSAGSSRFDASTPFSVSQHIRTVRRVVDVLGFDELAVVGHNSGGMIARHAMVGDPRMTAMGLINTEPVNPSLRFKSFVALRNMPGLGAALRWVTGNQRARQSQAGFGGLFADPSLMAGEFNEFFFSPLHSSDKHLAAALTVLRSFDMSFITELADIHRRIDVPVKLIWGDQDPFFPVERARSMVNEFPNATLDEIAGAGLFSHEEAPARVAESLLSLLTGAAGQ